MSEEITLESLSAKIAEQNEVIATQNEKIEELTGLINSGRATAGAAGKKEVTPTIPAEPIKHKKKEYKWNVAAFTLPGDPTRYTAAEASVTPALLDKLLAIKGQKALKELE